MVQTTIVYLELVSVDRLMETTSSFDCQVWKYFLNDDFKWVDREGRGGFLGTLDALGDWSVKN